MWINCPSAKFVWSNQTIINYRIRFIPPDQVVKGMHLIGADLISNHQDWLPFFLIVPPPELIRRPAGNIYGLWRNSDFHMASYWPDPQFPAPSIEFKLSVKIVGEIQNRHSSHKPESDHLLGERWLLQPPHPPLKLLEISLMTSYPCNLTVKICESHI